MLIVYSLLINHQLKKIFNRFFATVIGLLIFIIPIVDCAAKVESTIVTVDCAPDYNCAPWKEVFPSDPKVTVTLETEGLLFKKDPWIKYVSTNIDKFVYSYSMDKKEGNRIDSSIFQNSNYNVGLVFFNGKNSYLLPQLSNEDGIVSAYSSTINMPVFIFAACTRVLSVSNFEDQAPKNTKETEGTKCFRDQIINMITSSNFEDVVTNSSVDMWPKDKVLQCKKGQGIAVKFISPNSHLSRGIRYYAKLTIVRDDDEKVSKTKVSINDNSIVEEITPEKVRIAWPVIEITISDLVLPVTNKL